MFELPFLYLSPKCHTIIIYIGLHVLFQATLELVIEEGKPPPTVKNPKLRLAQLEIQVPKTQAALRREEEARQAVQASAQAAKEGRAQQVAVDAELRRMVRRIACLLRSVSI